MALRRFIARRGKPHELLSDQGTNFKGGERELSEAVAALQPTLQEEVLRTVLIEIEGILNSKPLGYMSSDVADVDPVTPNSLLMGRPDSALPQVVYPESEMLSRKRWRHSQWDGTSPTEGDGGTGADYRRADTQEGEEGQGYNQPRVADSRGASVQATGRLQRQTGGSGIGKPRRHARKADNAAEATSVQRNSVAGVVRRAGPYRSRLPSSSTKATEAPAVGKRGRDGAVRRTPPREPTLLNQVHTPVPKPSTALPAQVAKIPATSLEASTSAFTKAAEHKSHPRVGRLGKASGLYLHCWLDGQACRALVDTGATISLVRPGVLHNTGGPQLPGSWTPTATPLTSVTGAKMAMRGKKEVKVTVTGQEVSHEFWLADIADSCIIGLDLLKRWGACVYVSRGSITLGTETVALQSGPTRKPARRACHLATTARPASKLLQLATAPKLPSLTTVPQPDHSLAHHHQPATQQPPAQPKPALPAETTAAVHALWQRRSSGLDHQQRQQLKSLLDGNADLFAVRDEDCTQTELVQHTINTDTAQPIRLRPHRMSPAKRLVAEEKVKEMAAAGVIEPSDSPWAAPAVLVQKKSGEWRFCVDYRRLNFVTTKDSYPLPRIDEALDHISGSSWFSSLDLRSGYWQVRLAPEAKPKTAFTIGHGLWQFRVMPFGLCNAPATFERLMDRVLAAVPRSRCVVYLDDLLVHASDFQQALANLTDVLAAIRQAGLRLNPKKCQLLRRETAFLGHIVSERA
ncbi:hypothetical protein SKAU_G00274460 [Synaphobranchus kaupii]|uniref:ribonuclease H n=1 Tax=Synaphobranchus kaupii TaxID=118154 RepID=A0A9Q1IQQ1_SYNKA|nr:hypothetical protein SKAU_G00274460 [Synaphobranchus kaupii]